MTGDLKSRVTRLERRDGNAKRAGPCELCGGYGPALGLGIALYTEDEDGNLRGPDWVASDGTCAGCGAIPKAYWTEDWDLL